MKKFAISNVGGFVINNVASGLFIALTYRHGKT